MKLFSRTKTNILLALVFVLLFGSALNVVVFTPPVESQQPEQKVPDSTVVRVESSRVDALEEAASQAGLDVTQTLTLPGDESLITLDARPSTVTVALGAGPDAPLSLQMAQQLNVSPNYTYEPAATPNDPKYQNGDQWNMDKINMPKAWDITTGSSGTTIAVVDSGVLFDQQPYHNHSDMNDSQRWENSAEVSGVDGVDDDGNGFVDDKYGWDFMGGFVGDSNCPNNSDADPGDTSSTYISEDNDPQPYSCDNENDPTLLNKNHYNGDCAVDVSSGGACYIGHGTLVASTAAAATDNSTLAAGVDWNTRIMNLRVFDGYGRATTGRVVAAIEYATENGADAINLSLALHDQETGSCDITDSSVETALQNARDTGIITAAASGNGFEDHVCFPASSDHTIAVGASNQNDERASFSNYGDTLDLIAPGSSVPALTAPAASNSGSEYVTGVNGTSLSTPLVTGAAALLKGVFPDVSFPQARTLLRNGADTVPQMNGSDSTLKHGDGRLNTHETLQRANQVHPDGLLVSPDGSPHIYLIENGKKRYIPNPATLNSHNYRWKSVKTATLATADLPDGNPLKLREGVLIEATNDNKVYIVDHKDSDGTVQKRHIGSPSVFTGLGFKWDNVMKVKPGVLPDSNGSPVDSVDRHPDGVLVSPDDNPRIYLLQAGQRRYIPNPATLKSHRFQNGVKEATENDMNFSKGDSLDFREGTLLKDGDPPIYVVNHTGDGTVEKRHVKTLFVYRLLELGSSKTFRVSSSALPDQNGAAIK